MKALMSLVVIHLVLALIAVRVARGRLPQWHHRTKIFALMAAWLIPLLGPLLVFLAAIGKSESGGGDPNLAHSVDLLVTHDHTNHD